jgi:secreted trypsin-like serine protease
MPKNTSRSKRGAPDHRLTLGVLACALPCLALCCSSSDDEPLKRTATGIVGGTLLAQHAYPDVGALLAPGNPSGVLCSAVLVDDTHALTAAHCILPGQQLVFVASAQPSEASPTQIIPIDSTEVHPEFVRNPTSDTEPLHDIAIVTLSHAVEGIASFRHFGHPSVNSRLTIVGFGVTKPPPGGTASLENEAMTTVTSVSSTEFTTGPLPAPQPCFGDSGGPALLQDEPATLVGLVSRSLIDTDAICTQGTAYTRVDAHSDWVTSVLTPPSRSSSGCSVCLPRAPAPGTARLLFAVLAGAILRSCAGRRRAPVTSQDGDGIRRA